MRLGKRLGFGFLCALLAILTCFCYSDANAQRRKKRRSVKRDVIHIKAPSIRHKAGKRKPASRRRAVSASRTASTTRSSKIKAIPYRQFMPEKAPTIVTESYDSLNDAETNIVEVEEQVMMDCTWVKVTEYYNLWDSRRVNPYGTKAATFSDTVSITLYDTTMGAYYSPPMRQTHPTSHFGPRGGRFHYGTDLELDIGDSIRSCFDGIVRITSFDGRGYGYYVLVRHYNGLETLYGHLSGITTEVGEFVKAGQVIGLGGNTGRSSGPHLHFEIRYQGNAINTEDFFDYKTNSLISDQFVLSPAQFSYVTKAARKVFYHRVRGGDTMYSVASRYGITIKELARLNRISPRSRLRAGKRLRVK